MRASLIVLAVATVVTLVMAAPVLRAPTERLFGKELVGRHHDAYTVIQQLESPRPLGPYTQPATDWLGAAAARLLGPVPAFNLLILWTFPAAALCAFWLARDLGIAPRGAGASALLYAFAPFHVAHAAYHPHIAQTQWLPLYLLALTRAARRFTLGRAGFLLVAGLVAVLSNFYYGLILGTLTPVILAACWLWPPRPAGAGKRPTAAVAATTITLLATATVGLLYVETFAPGVLQAPGAYAFPRADLGHYAARWWSYLLPASDHPLFGGAVRSVWADYGIGDALLEQQIYLGLTPLALAAYALYRWLRRRDDPGFRAVPAVVAIAVAAFLSSLSPERQIGPFATVRPSAFLYGILPMFRAYARFGLVVSLATVLLAGIAVSALARDRRRATGPLLFTLLTLAVLELAPFPPWRWHDVLPTAAHRWLADNARPGWKLLDCVTPGVAEASVDRFLAVPRATLGDRQRSASFDDCREPGVAGKLAAHGFTHLLIRTGTPDGLALIHSGPAPGTAVVQSFADATVLAVVAQPAEVSVSELTGFSFREDKGEASYRWMGAHGTLTLTSGGGPRRGTFEMRLMAFHTPREVRISATDAAGRRVATTTAQVGVESTVVPVPLEWSGGGLRLEILPRGAPLVPAVILGNGDERELTIALWDWRWIPADTERP